jgi:hypothetical protein
MALVPSKAATRRPRRDSPDKIAASLQPSAALRVDGDVTPAPPEADQILRESIMGLLLLIIILILLFGGGGGYYGYRTYGGPGLGGVLGLIVVILIVLWLVGGLGPYTAHV